MRQARIVEALEAEKRKISKELEEMQKKRALRENQTPRNGESFQVTIEHILEKIMTSRTLLMGFQIGWVHSFKGDRESQTALTRLC